ncbi:hypothetical protein [Pseudomonas viridiflava]|uniref:hypothetical protein n=1 Tax=Pseudomonas viridiflava TaxID=33069 RepID=UPI000F05FCF0|nr:hypothetical protein [Pseudomonas viridiflava]
MTRNEYEDLETMATAAFVGLIASGQTSHTQPLATMAFDLAEQFQKEREARLGEKPPYDM